MAFFDNAFELDELPEGNDNFEPLPPGWYQASITKTELKTTKAGTGQYVSLQFDILGPTHQGRVVFTNLNIRNPNAKSQEIGLSQLGDIMRAGGLAKVQDSDELFGINLQIKLSVKNDPEYGTRNEVKGYKALEGSAPPMQKQAKAKQPAQKSGGGLPWEK